MNAADLVAARIPSISAKTAIWTPKSERFSFRDLQNVATQMQRFLRQEKMQPGDAILVAVGLSPELYGVILGAISFGCRVVFVEPWMPLSDLERVVHSVAPRLFLTGILGGLWGARVKAIRTIPRWSTLRAIAKTSPASSIHVESCAPEQAAIITFTTGTTGSPKGVIRTHGILAAQHPILEKALHLEKTIGADIVVFANFVLSNLAAGRTSVLLGNPWNKKTVGSLANLTGDLKPTSFTVGPALLDFFMTHAPGMPIQSVHAGGSPVDCTVYERGFQTFREAEWIHVYGSTEAEPVAAVDAKVAVQKSREHGYSQAIFLGRPISDVETSLEETGLWVKGPHVCKEYIGNEEETRKNKRRDAAGAIWHNMGDRIVQDEDSRWWYKGRVNSSKDDFDTEQKIHTLLGKTSQFLHRHDSDIYLVGEDLKDRTDLVREAFPQIKEIVTIKKILVDRRHRSRIDRTGTIRKYAAWLAG